MNMQEQQTIEFNSPIGNISAGDFACSDTYYDVARKLNVPITSQPIVCVRGDVPVLRADWDKPIGLSPEPVKFLQIPRGKTLKSILGVVASIALSLVAGPIAGLIAVKGTLAYSLISAAIILGGTFLINTFLAPKASTPTQETSTEASPTYNLQGQSNSARLLDPIPRLYGEHNMFPDYASQPYQSYESNEQYLYQLFCLGVGNYEVQKINIDKTELWNKTSGFTQTFADVQLEIVPPGAKVTLFPSNVITSSEVSGAELRNESFSGAGSFSGTRFNFSAAQAAIEFLSPGDVLVVSNAGVNNGSWTINDLDEAGKTWIQFSHTFTSSSATPTFNLDNWIGPFVVNPPDQLTNLIKVDVVLPRGLYYSNDNGGLSATSLSYTLQVRTINSAGVATSDWITLTNETFSDATTTAKRYTRSYNVGLARYQARMARTSVKNHNARYGNEISWEGLRAFIPDDNIYEDVTLLAMKIRASNQLTQQSSTKVNVVQRGLVPTYSVANGWSNPVFSDNPAWIAADMLRNQVYGAKLPDSRIDINKLLQLSQIYAARQDSFNGVFDTSKTFWEALSSVLNVVRTQPLLVAGQITFVRDQPKALAKTVITPQSILKNTFEMQHVLKNEESADDVIVEFMNRDTWTNSEVQCTLPGSTSENPARIQMFGVTNISQAWREGMYYAAVNSYRRVFANISTEADGRMLLKGDPVIVSHDVPDWSQNGYIYNWIEAEKTLVFDRAVKFTNAAPHFIILRRRDGKEFGPILCFSNGYDNEAKLDAGSLSAIETAQGITIDEVIYVGDNAKYTSYVFGPTEDFVKRFIVMNSTVRDLTKVDVGLVIDDDRVYTADAGTPPPGVTYAGPGVAPNGPAVSSLTAALAPGSAANPVTLNVSWPAASGANNYILQNSLNGFDWFTIYTGTDPVTQVVVQSGDVFLRVAAIGNILGPWAYTSPSPQQFGTASTLPGIISNLVIDARTSSSTPLVATFSTALRATSYKIDVHIEAVSGSGNYNSLVLTRTDTPTTFSWTTAQIAAAGGPWARGRMTITAINGAGSSDPVVTFFTFGT